MPSYQYSAVTSTGKVQSGMMSASNADELRKTLKSQNLTLQSFQEKQAAQSRSVYKYKTKPLAIFTRQLSSMLLAGVNLVRAVHIMMQQEENKACQKLLRDIYEDLQKGNSFTDVLQKRRGSFPNLFISMVAAGEASGNLDLIIQRVSDHYMSEAKTENTVRKAMIYPIILCILMFGIIMAMFGFIMPMFASMFEDASQIPPLSRAMMSFSDFIRAYWWLVIGIVVGIILLIPRLMKVKGFRYWWGKQQITMPKVGKLVGTIYTARFARTMSNLFASGLQMIDCIEKSCDVLGNDYVTEKFKVVLDDVKRGETLSSSLAKTGIFSGIFTSTVLIGEESGQLDSILSKSADFYEEEANTAIESLVSMLEPLLIIVMGGAVGLVLAAIFPMLYGSFGGLENQ